MKQVVVEEVVKKHVYEAIDGTHFTSKEECEKYEKSARLAINTLYKKFIIKTISEADLTPLGSDEGTIEIIKIHTQEDIKVLLQMYNLYGGSYQPTLDKIATEAQESIDNNDYLFVGRGYECDDNFWIIGTRQSLINNINLICNETN